MSRDRGGVAVLSAKAVAVLSAKAKENVPVLLVSAPDSPFSFDLARRGTGS